MIALCTESKGITPDPVVGQRAIGNIVVAMRQDLHAKTRLGYKALT